MQQTLLVHFLCVLLLIYILLFLQCFLLRFEFAYTHTMYYLAQVYKNIGESNLVDVLHCTVVACYCQTCSRYFIMQHQNGTTFSKLLQLLCTYCEILSLFDLKGHCLIIFKLMFKSSLLTPTFM